MEYQLPQYRYLTESRLFIRVEDRIYVTRINDASNHAELALQDGLVEEIEELRNQRPDALDAGSLKIRKQKIHGVSISAGFQSH